MTIQVFSERRADDRIKMADAIEQLVVECGATFTRAQGDAYPGPHEVKIYITAPGGLQLLVEFRRKSPQPDVYVLCWHMGFKSTKRLNNATFGGNVNPHHFCKATYVARGFVDLCTQLRAGLLMCKDGTAYLPDAP
jgi:hypothetical protein